jgi:predicted Zn-dependent protease
VQNQPRQVAIIHPDQAAYMLFGFSDADTPQAAASTFAGQDGLSVLENRSRTVNGYDARRVLAEGQTQRGQTVRLLAYFIAYRDHVYKFQGVTTGERYSNYRPTFERSMESFNRLTDPQKLNIEPTRITIRPAGQQASFRTFVDEGRLPEGMTEGDLAIINQLDLNETVAPDRRLKLPIK